MRRLALLGAVGALLVSASPAVAQTGAAPLPQGCERLVPFDPGQFGSPTVIDNRFLPLTPGTQLVLEGRASRTGMPLPHTVTFTVTDLTKVIDGVPSRVMWDVDESEGEVVEAELSFFAQDDDGNVWNLGEYPEEYEDGFFLGAPNTWIAGLEDAEAGIHMLDHVQVGLTYLQGFSPGIDFLDCAEVVAENLQECDIPVAPGGCFDNGVLTHERSPLDPSGAIQTKYHAPDVGIAKIGALNDPEGETLVLSRIVTLDQAQMAAVRQEALRLDQRGFRVSDVYCQTEPMEPNPPADCPEPGVPAPDGTPAAPGGSTSPGGPPASEGGVLAPSTPVTKTKHRSRRKSCYAKRSRSSARRRARGVVTPGTSRSLVKKIRRKTCAELLSRR